MGLDKRFHSGFAATVCATEFPWQSFVLRGAMIFNCFNSAGLDLSAFEESLNVKKKEKENSKERHNMTLGG